MIISSEACDSPKRSVASARGSYRRAMLVVKSLW